MSVQTMQRSLEKALSRALQADDRELAGRVRDEGQRMLFLLNGLIRTCRLYTSDNAAFEGPSAEVSRLLTGLLQLLGAVHVVCVEDQVYINDVRLRVRPNDQDVLTNLIEEMGRHDVGGVSFHMPLDPSMVRDLARALSDPVADPAAPRLALARRLAPTVPLVELTGRYRFRLKGEQAPVRREFGEILRQGTAVAREAFANLALGRLPNPLPVRRAVIDLVDSLREDAGRAAAAPLRRRGHGVGDQHLLSVSSLAIQLGLRMGLDDAALSDLGVTAMLHDVGYIQKADRDGHATAGARVLLRQRGFHEGKIRRLLAVIEHHESAEARPSLFARILRIVDDYDVLTAARPGQPQMPPATAQAAMWAARGTIYDADLLALFVQMMGLYPPGSLLELSDGRLVVSVSGGRDPDRFAWPIVRVVRDSPGAVSDSVGPVDLYEIREKVKPKRVVNPATHSIDVADVLNQVLDRN